MIRKRYDLQLENINGEEFLVAKDDQTKYRTDALAIILKAAIKTNKLSGGVAKQNADSTKYIFELDSKDDKTHDKVREKFVVNVKNIDKNCD